MCLKINYKTKLAAYHYSDILPLAMLYFVNILTYASPTEQANGQIAISLSKKTANSKEMFFYDNSTAMCYSCKTWLIIKV